MRMQSAPHSPSLASDRSRTQALEKEKDQTVARTVGKSQGFLGQG
jgi:hypothetical protein